MPDLVFSMGGDSSGFERALANVLVSATTKSRALEAIFKSSAARIDAQIGSSIGSAESLSRVMSGLKIAGGIFLGFEALKFVIDAVRSSAADAAKDIGHLTELGNKARDAQVGTGFFQAFIGSAKELGLEVSQAESIITQARDALETKVGEGDGPNLGSTATDRVKQNVMAGNLPAVSEQDLANATSMEDRIRVILDLISQLQAKNANAAAFDLGGKVFGADFETKLRAGVDIVGQMQRSLNGVAATEEGRVRSAEEIANAQRISLEVQQQNVRIAALWADYQQLVSEYNQGNLEILVQVKGLIVDVVETAKQVVGVFERIEKILASWSVDVENFDAKLSQALGAGKIHDALQKIGLTFDKPVPLLQAGQRQGGSEVSRDFTRFGIRPGLAPLDNPRIDTSRALPSLTPAHERAAHEPKAHEQKDEVENLITSLQKSAAAEAGEAAALGKSNAEKQRSIDLAKAEEAARERGKPLTEAERAKIIQLADAYSVAHQKIEDFNKAHQDLVRGMDEVRSGARDVLGTFTNDIEQGKTALEALADALKSFLDKVKDHVEDQAIDMLLGKSGSDKGGLINLAGLFSLGGSTPAAIAAAADGGIVRGPGGPRADAILARVSAGEAIIPADVVRDNPALVSTLIARKYADGGLVGAAMPRIPTALRPAAGTRGATTISAPLYIDARGAQAGVAEQIAEALGTYHRQLPGLLADHSARNG